MRRAALVIAFGVLWVFGAACRAAPAPAPTVAPAPQPTAQPDAVTGDVVVFAASSLTDAFKEIATAFQRLHPSARVVLSFGGSSQLAIQLVNGAPRRRLCQRRPGPDDGRPARQCARRRPASVLIQNRLMVIAPRDNPAHIAALADLERAGVKVIGAQASVPIGEADAAVVYATDITPAIADQLVRIALPAELQVIATYPIAVTNGHNRSGGEALVAFVQSPPAQAILLRWGFLPLPLPLRLPLQLQLQLQLQPRPGSTPSPAG
jgi:molybdate transport system substrate-binding protein